MTIQDKAKAVAKYLSEEIEEQVFLAVQDALLFERDRIAKFLLDAEPFIGKEWAKALADKCWETEE